MRASSRTYATDLATDGLQILAVTLTDRKLLVSNSPFCQILAGFGFFR